MAPSARI